MFLYMFFSVYLFFPLLLFYKFANDSIKNPNKLKKMLFTNKE